MNIPSPINTVTYEGFRFDVKRDDLIDPYISGNKWRKLKYLLKDAKEKGKNHLVTFGGAFSNHLVATAAAASRLGFKSTAFVRGEMVVNEMLTICRLFGMQLIFVDREAYKNKTCLFETNFGTAPDAYFIDEGGSGELATLGCAEIIDEMGNRYHHIFCAAGTGTTSAGLLRAMADQMPDTKLHVVSVLKGGGFLKNEIEKYGTKSASLQLHTDYHFGGYAKYNAELLDFICDFTSKTGILIDHVYTGKLFFALIDLLKRGVVSSDEKILVIHTGGLLGLLGIKDKLEQHLT